MTTATPKVPKVPEVLDNKTPGSLIDLVFVLREQRKLIEARADLIREDEKRIEEHLIQRLDKQELNALAGKLAKCSLTRTRMANAKDWDAINGYIESHDAWDLRNKALNQAALRARLEAGEDVPGVEWFTKVSLSIRKV
jgi:hypothetical protein